MKVKICGVTNVDDALEAEALGADYVGLIFAGASPRAVSPRRAGCIADALTTARPIGVFVEHRVDEVEAIADEVGLFAVQLYRRTSRAVRGVRTLRAVRVRDRRSLVGLRSTRTDYILLDSRNGSSMGGTGRAFDWSLLPERLERVFLAGGISPDNVREAVGRGPFAVDVCSGVESRPGRKSTKLLRRLFEELGR